MYKGETPSRLLNRGANLKSSSLASVYRWQHALVLLTDPNISEPFFIFMLKAFHNFTYIPCFNTKFNNLFLLTFFSNCSSTGGIPSVCLPRSNLWNEIVTTIKILPHSASLCLPFTTIRLCSCHGRTKAFMRNREANTLAPFVFSRIIYEAFSHI